MRSFMMIGVKGKQLCAGNPNADDRRTDGHGDSSIPPLLRCGGYNYEIELIPTDQCVKVVLPPFSLVLQNFFLGTLIPLQSL